MDKKSVLGLLLISAMFILYNLYKAPSAEEKAEMARVNDSIANYESSLASKASEQTTPQTNQEGQKTVVDSAVVAHQDSLTHFVNNSKYGIFSAASVGVEKEFVLENDKIKAVFNTKGGMFTSVILKEFKTIDSAQVRMWEESVSSMAIDFATPIGDFSTSNFYFNGKISSEGDNQRLTMTMPTNNTGQSIEFTYNLTKGSYIVDFEMTNHGLENMVRSGKDGPFLDWNILGISKEKGIIEERRRSSVYFRNHEDSRDYLSETSDDQEDLEDPMNWMAFKQQFFSAIVTSNDNFEASGSDIEIANLEDGNITHTRAYHAKLNIPLENGRADMQFYFGPNEMRALETLEVEEINRIIDYGPSIFGWVNKWMIRPAFQFLSDRGLSYGLIILILTIAIKSLLFPLTWKNYHSSAKMRVLKPEIDEINKQYEGKDAAQKQQAIMGLYSKTGVNPLAGCIPMVVQMPILYAMFRFFPATIELRHQDFLWADDLSSFDSIYSWTGDIPLISSFYGNHISLFTLLMAASTFFLTRMNSGQMAQQQQPGMPNMKVIMYMFPFMMLFFFNNFASGLSYYYLAANVITIAQMLLIKKYFVNEDKIRAAIETNKKKPKKAKSGFQQRLQVAMQEQQKKQGKK